MKSFTTYVLFLVPFIANAQAFDFAGKEAVKLPVAATVQIRRYIESHDGISLKTIGEQYAYIPVFNVLNRGQKEFVDGIYFFSWGAHDSGRLLINQKGKLTFLSNGYVSTILNDYSYYIKQNKLPETTQIAYLSAIAAFMKHRYKSQQHLIESGTILGSK